MFEFKIRSFLQDQGRNHPITERNIQKADTIDKSYNYLNYDIDKQREFCRYLCGYIGFDLIVGLLEKVPIPYLTIALFMMFALPIAI